ncbi:HTH-type transcriptional regulator GltC [Paenibacillus montaniterrae]|uniref:HTH-type transcriptional regulator GltC n=1 Tax=Paenibacillus montaniterrae TaxID=429341 RepID=A0A919YNK2_9BACL|nr:LysR family transcriptional regulator [Paenibacillus montaniterrae]GIP15391.1 HTH-type transcriptional regulator GltC [Paenibacillus montaniterrae]
MELRQLYYFVKVAKKEHVTQAAEELHVAQSAVSRQIHQLEEELGVKLFVQKGRNLQLTPVGQLFLRRADEILRDLDRAVQEVHEFLDPEKGEIRLGFPHSLGISLVPQVVAAFRCLNPDVRFRFKQGMYPSLIRDLVKGEIDLAFISPVPNDVEQVTGKILITEELFAIFPSTHRLAKREQVRLEELKSDPFIMFSEGYSLRPLVMNACETAGFTPNIAFEGEETETIRGLVAAGMGISLLPKLAVEYIAPLPISIVKVVDPVVTRNIGLIHRTNEKLPLVAKVFYNFLMNYFANELKK